MDKNPYAAPTAEVDVRAARLAIPDGQAWFAVGTRKLLVMSVLSFGLYTIHWFERQYRFQKRARGESTRPVARAIFSIFFANDLFGRIERAAARANVEHAWTATGMAGLFIMSAVLNRVLDRVSTALTNGTASSVLALASFVLILGLAYPLVRVQRTVNEMLVRADPGYERNETYTLWNWLLMVLGGGLMVMALIGSFLPGE